MNIRAYAKINLSLDIVSKREDGYHDLKTVMHRVNLFDELSFEKNGSGNSRIITENRNVPKDGKNIIIKTIDKFYSYTGLPREGFDIYLKKNIPVCAGLGGGSADSAATLKYINEYYESPLSESELGLIGSSIGADVPFCLKGGTCLCEGIGEIITPLSPLPECDIVIAKPAANGLSTAKIFSLADLSKMKYHPDTDGLISALEAGDILNVCKRVFNVLEIYSVPECKEIELFKNILIDSGADAASMSGSGSAVFGIFTNESSAKEAFDRLSKMTPEVFIV